MKHRLLAAGRHAPILLFLVALSTPTIGAEVSGMVTLDGRPFSGTLLLQQSGVQVEINNGEYRVLVPAGVYDVVVSDAKGQTFKATIQSSTAPIRWDIELKPR